MLICISFFFCSQFCDMIKLLSSFSRKGRKGLYTNVVPASHAGAGRVWLVMKKKSRWNPKYAIVCLILFAVIGFIVYYMVSANSKQGEKGDSGDGTEKKPQTEISGEMKDGELIDYEKNGSLKLDNYIGIKATVTPTKQEVYEAILQNVKKKKVSISGEERVKKGDWVLMDYEGEIGGQKMEELEETDIVIQVGAGDLFNADFERKLTGLSVGQEYFFDVSFPENYFDLDVAGQTVKFTVTISRKFNEAFVKPLTDNKYQKEEDYFAYIKAKEKEKNVDALGDMIWDDFLEKCKVLKYPKGSKEQAFKDLKRQYKGVGDMSSLSYEEVIMELGMTEDDVKDLAGDEVKGRMVAKSIAVKENLVLSEEQYRQYLMDEVSPSDDEELSLEDLEKRYEKDNSVYPRDDMLIRLVKEFVGKQAKQR